MKKNQKKMSGMEKMAIGAGTAVLSVASAGAYYLFGPKAKAHQKKTKVLVAKIKKEISNEVKKAKNITMPAYHNIVDTISSGYAKQYKIHEKDAKALANKLKNEWRGVNKKVGKTIKNLKK